MTPPRLPAGNPQTMQRGFTLVELVALIAIAGILAAVVAPRFFSAATFNARGFADQTAVFLRYAQKLAVARHGQVHVQAGADTLSLCSSATSPCPTGQELSGPDGTTPYQVAAPSGVGLSVTGGDFAFDAHGRPSGGRVLTISGDTGLTLTVEAETGYVH